MAVLQMAGLAKYWGAETLFKDVDLLVNEGEKVALVGRNGTGKTTLLRLVLGRVEPDAGTVTLSAGCRVGYLSQDPEFMTGRTVLTEAQSVFAQLERWAEELRALERQMGASRDETQLQMLMERYAQLLARYEEAGAYSVTARVKAVLFGLGFAEGDLDKPVEALSGGQKVRLGLARLLLEEPDLLLLDEPTNHLDLAATEWLEGQLKTLKSAALLVSHDRYFLDRVATKTFELENQTGVFYAGNFSFSREEKRRRLEQAIEAYERNQAERARLREFYEKWRSTPTRKSQALSRKRQLDKMEVLERPVSHRKDMKLDFRVGRGSGNDVLAVEGLRLAYGDHVVLSGLTLRVAKGDRVALVGPNGAGKTTLLKALAGRLAPAGGHLRWGANVELGYFSQDLEGLDPTRTCLEEMLAIPGFTRYDAHALLGRFLFSGEDALKLIGRCSGGERNRLVLAKLTVSGANVLLLDEPTNHLDLESKAVLEEALVEYPGTVLFVSHDRYFVDRVATKVWEVSSGGVTEYAGNYSAYKAEKERRAALAATAAPPPPKPAVAARQEAKDAE
ncbi:MAG TPA: ABC-F family ATP-binding cassette domain-containing protein, partial [Firmicutes bacterium]|nr:ABC-F family ATP-binding cassette domain-containing protein [Bacillota bacterium]